MKPQSQPSLQISFLPKLCDLGMREGGIWKCSVRGATMANFFSKFGLSFFQGSFFHPTMQEGGIRKCSEREGHYGQIILKWYFFHPTFLQNLVCSINDLFNFQYSQSKARWQEFVGVILSLSTFYRKNLINLRTIVDLFFSHFFQYF